jgi:hypothetical protein
MIVQASCRSRRVDRTSTSGVALALEPRLNQIRDWEPRGFTNFSDRSTGYRHQGRFLTRAGQIDHLGANSFA